MHENGVHVDLQTGTTFSQTSLDWLGLHGVDDTFVFIQESMDVSVGVETTSSGIHFSAILGGVPLGDVT